ncbi:glycoside hydrolase family 3 protein [Macrolepiota fuliginosa MF-IS2]|uniref:beta-glucosidase n=1 Tax=Macrolepiota fuliginosa MF-IS2 TaxID=1400762 RepID=A0A9P5XBB2_9AGAR|nr:glycoside hydrolase family 3 protein [Macrolepiota fuliginosa MF-IS2]
MAVNFDIESVLTKLTVADKVKLLSGLGWWNTEPIPRAGVPSIKLSDGPNGIRGSYFFNGTPSSCFPCSTGLGSSFDVELARRVGEALGDEARAKGVHVLLAPTVNTQRSPLGGRGFESFAEDPHLNGTIAAAYINGLQSKGISATIKHFVANDQEYQRFSISSEVSERALREIYLKPFQIAIKNANPWAVMSAYNRVNGLHVSEDKRLLDDVLRKEWGFKGMIMSDWIGVYSTAESIKAGLDLEMPGPSVMRGRALERALAAEKVFVRDLDVRVRKVLGLVKKGIESGVPFDVGEGFVDTPEQRQILREAARDAIVLLKNDKKLLPLSNQYKKIAVIGPNAAIAMTSGGGSARLLSTYATSPLEGIQAAAKEIGAEVTYTIGATTHKYLHLLNPYIHLSSGGPGALMEFWNDMPSKDFMSTTPDLPAPLSDPTWTTTTKSTDCFLMDNIDEKVNYVCWIKYSTKFVPNEDGDWEFSLNVAGRANLFFDNKLLIDLSTNPEQGDSFFGIGTVDLRAVAPALKAGQDYNLEIRLENAEFAERGSPFKSWGGIRIGGFRKIEPEVELKHAVEIASDADVVVLVVGLNHDLESEGFDRPHMDLPGLTDTLVSEIFKANPNTIVVNQTGTPVTMPWISEASTLVQAFFGGNELGNALADILFGKVNPSGKLPLTFPQRLEDSPAYPSYGDKGQEHGKILYNEGIFVGYRSYEIRKLAPLFPFGFGLSYTTFKYSDLKTSSISEEGKFSVTFTITNTGHINGREIAQVYISDTQASLPRPVKELKAFTKVTLAPGEGKSVTLDLDKEALGFYDDRAAQWIAEKGTFTVHVAASSSDLRLEGSIELRKTLTWIGL